MYALQELRHDGARKPAIPAQWLFQAWNTQSLSSKHICTYIFHSTCVCIYMYVHELYVHVYIFRKINLHECMYTLLLQSPPSAKCSPWKK